MIHVRTRLAFCLLVLTLVPPFGRCAGAEQWLVVTAPAFRGAIEPLCEQRKAQGMSVRVVQTTDALTDAEVIQADTDKLRQHVNRLCKEFDGTSYVLLVGAVDPGLGRERLADAAKKVVPALAGTVGRMKSEPSDNGYGCPGEGLAPSVAVGRLPARSVEEARAMVAKTLAYERDDRIGDWRRRVTILAGAPRFTPAVDLLVESVALSRLDKLDPSWTGRAIYYNPSSRFCVPDEQLRERARRYVEEGEAITLYLGHSNAAGFAAGRLPYLDRTDWAAVKIARGPGVFATFGCLGCQLRGPDGEGYGVAAMRNPQGPVAVIGSHGICFAAMVQLAADGLVESYFARETPRRLGQSWLSLKGGLAKGSINPITFRLLDALDGDSRIPQETQRREHVEMFVLLGDPALKLATVPVNVKLTAAGAIKPGRGVTIQGTAPAELEGATASLTLERPLSSAPAGLQPLDGLGAAEQRKVMLANHDRANSFVLASAETIVKDGRFAVTLPVPEKMAWKQVVIRARLSTGTKQGTGTLTVVTDPSGDTRQEKEK